MAEPDWPHMDIAEFCRMGFLQEANRLFFHPRGLALVVEVDANGTEHLAGILDHRFDPEGIAFGPGQMQMDKVRKVQAEFDRHHQARVDLMGSVIQHPWAPVVSPAPDEDPES